MSAEQMEGDLLLTMEPRPLGRILREAMDAKAVELGKYTYRDLENDSGVDFTHGIRAVSGERNPRPEVIQAWAAALAPYFPLNEALLAAGHAPDPGAISRILSGEDIDFSIDDAPWDTDVVGVGHGGSGGGLIEQLTLWPVRFRRGRLLPIRISGDCMEPVLHHGDLLIIDLDARIEDNTFAFFESEDGWVIRRFHTDGERQWFTCENPEAGEDVAPLPETPVYRITERRERL